MTNMSNTSEVQTPLGISLTTYRSYMEVCFRCAEEEGRAARSGLLNESERYELAARLRKLANKLEQGPQTTKVADSEHC